MKNKFLSMMILGATVLTSMTGVYASAVNFVDKEIPVRQHNAVLNPANVSTPGGAANGLVWLSKCEADAVTFKATNNGHDFGGDTTVYGAGKTLAVTYNATYAPGTQMQAHFRNHNWSNNNNSMSGVFDYR